MESIPRKLIEHTIDFSANCRAARSAGDQSHFADHSMTAETAHTYDAIAVHSNKNANATLKDEMHGVGRFALPGDVMARLYFLSRAMLRYLARILRTAEC